MKILDSTIDSIKSMQDATGLDILKHIKDPKNVDEEFIINVLLVLSCYNAKMLSYKANKNG